MSRLIVFCFFEKKRRNKAKFSKEKKLLTEHLDKVNENVAK